MGTEQPPGVAGPGRATGLSLWARAGTSLGGQGWVRTVCLTPPGVMDWEL